MNNYYFQKLVRNASKSNYARWQVGEILAKADRDGKTIDIYDDGDIMIYDSPAEKKVNYCLLRHQLWEMDNGNLTAQKRINQYLYDAGITITQLKELIIKEVGCLYEKN